MKKNLVIGTMDVQPDPQGLTANLTFTPKEDGEEWEPDILKAFLEKKRVTHGFTIQSLDQVLMQFGSAAGEPITAVVANAIQPGPPIPDEIVWEDHPIPDSLAEDARAFYAQLGPPELFSIRMESYEEKKMETKKSLFGSKQVEVVVKKKREVKDLISVNPQVLGQGWVVAGADLAGVTPGGPGKEGTNIFGRVIQPERPSESLNIGAGVERTGNVIKSTISGFLRRGEDWVEVIPFSTHNWEVSLSKDQNTFLLSFTPGGKNATPPLAEDILADAVSKGGAEETLQSAFEIGSLIQKAIDGQRGFENVPISSSDDGSFDIVVSEDKLQVFLNMKKSRGSGKPLVLKEFGKALKGANFTGPDYAKIQADVLDFYRGGENVLTDYLIVEGTAPEPPGDTKVQVTLKYLKEEQVASIKEQSGRSAADPEWKKQITEEIPSLIEKPLDTAEKMAEVTAGVVIAEVVFTPGKPGKDVFGETIPSEVVGDSGIRLLEGLEKKGNQVISTIDGIVDQWAGEKGPIFRVRPHRDCIVLLQLAANKMSASMSLRQAIGTGQPLNHGLVLEAIKEKGIIKGINEEVVSRGVEHANEGQEIEGLVFANGQLPTEGSKEEFSLTVEEASHKGVTIKENGTADYRNQDQITLVKKGQTLAVVKKNGEGPQEGWDVMGQTIPPKETAPLEVIAGENVSSKDNSEGNTIYVADKGGEFVFERGTLSVSAVHTIQGNVGKASGNVKFSGTVKVAGYIQAGYFVMAEEDVFIKDNVEASLVSAGGSVFIEKGIVGGGKAVIRARKSIQAGFAEQCTLLAIDDIIMGRGCMKCSIKTNGRVLLKKDKSSLLGGKILARGGIEAFNIGSEKQITTTLSFGQDFLVFDQIEVEEKETQKAKNALIKVDLRLSQAEKQGAKEALAKLRPEKVRLMKIIEKRGMRTLMLREKFEEHFPGEIKVKGTIYPGVVIESHGRTLEIMKEYKNVTIKFELETGRLKIEDNK